MTQSISVVCSMYIPELLCAPGIGSGLIDTVPSSAVAGSQCRRCAEREHRFGKDSAGVGRSLAVGRDSARSPHRTAPGDDKAGQEQL